jgi:lipopolysaccharide transport system permease protein
MLTAITDHAKVFTQWNTWWLMAGQDIKLRYRRSLIGPFWISAAMAAQVIGLGLLFSSIFMQPVGPFLVYMGAGLLMWGLISTLMLEGCTALVDSEGHLRALPVPTSVLAARLVHRAVIIFLHNAVVIGVLMVFMGLRIEPTMVAAIPGLLLVVAFGYFWTVTMAPLCLRFRDITQVLSSVISIAFFVTPIIWQTSQGRVDAWVIQGNPLYHLVEVVRSPLLGEWPTMLNWAVSGGTVALFAITSLIALSVSRGRVYLWL